MLRLSVNINKIATLRNARGGNLPDVLQVAKDCETFGADGITVHPRPDERHIRTSDVRQLAPMVRGEFNVEGYPSKAFLELVLEVKPHQVTLVPDPPEALTSNAGWDVAKHVDFLGEVVEALHASGIRVSLFMEPNAKLMEKAAATGADRIELYTESYARNFPLTGTACLQPFVEAAQAAREAGLGVHAGHDLNLNNLPALVKHIPFLMEVSIGHALVCDALYYGLQNTVGMYRHICQPPKSML